MGQGDDQMTSGKLATEYIHKTERVLKQLKLAETSVCLDEAGAREVVEEAKRYLEDAKYYLDRREFETSLASVAYCEGLLDALRMLGIVEFSW